MYLTGEQKVQTQSREIAECGIWSGSTLFVTHSVILDKSRGNKIVLFKF